jgi:Tol biopolymer transport system component
MKRHFLPVMLIAGLMMIGCSGLPAPFGPGQPTPTLFVLPTAAPPGENLPTLTPAPPTPTAEPRTETPPLELWPLPADLYYLNEEGQVWQQPATGDESAAQPISPSSEKVTDFGIAPGGEWLMYRSEGKVSVLSLDTLKGQTIAEGTGSPADPGVGSTLAWSPDASRLAYTTISGFQVYIPGDGPSLMPLLFSVDTWTDAAADLRWSPDARWLLAIREDRFSVLCDTADINAISCFDLGRLNAAIWLMDGRLAFAPAEGGLALLAPDDAASRVFLVDQNFQVDLVGQRPDGLLSLFTHSGTLSDPGYLNVADPSALTHQQVNGTPYPTHELHWDPTTRLLAGPAGDPGMMRLTDPQSGAEGTFRTSADMISLAWGDTQPTGVFGLTMPANLYFLAPQAGLNQVWRLPSGGSAPSAITNASTDVLAFDVSPDGSHLAYTSNNQIFLQEINTVYVVPVAQILPDANVPSATPAISPEGSRIAYANNGIWVYDTLAKSLIQLVADRKTEGQAQQTTIYDQPRWSPDGRWLLVRARFFQGYDHALIDMSTRSAPVALNQFNAQAEWSADGSLLVYSDGSNFSQPQVVRITPVGSRVPLVLAQIPVLDAQIRADGRYALLRAPSPVPFGPTSVRVFSVTADGSDPRAETASMLIEKPVLSPDGSVIAGLVRIKRADDGSARGQLVVASPFTGERFIITSMLNAFDLLWAK